MTDLKRGGFSPPGTWDRNWNPNPGGLLLQGQPPQQWPCLQRQALKDGVVMWLMKAAEASGGTGQTCDTGGGEVESRQGSSSWLRNTVMRDREDGAPFIRGLASPSLLPSWQLQNIPFGQQPQK